MILLLILLSSLWTILLFDYIVPFKKIKDQIGLGRTRKLFSGYKFINFLITILYKLINCPSCFSSHLFWISYLIIYHSLFGMILCPIVFFLTFIIKEHLLTIKL